jgi:hypothetical protein
MKTIVVGDIHGRQEIVEEILKETCNIVFVGDYVDSYDRSIGDQVECLRLVLDAINTSKGRVRGLKGNHEMSYLDSSQKCSGYEDVTQSHLTHIDMTPLLDYVWVDDYLISHAGISQDLLDHSKQTYQQYLDEGSFNQIGYARGGMQPVGGLRWCDWFREFEPVEGLKQVVGHSGYRPESYRKGILEREGSYNIDCFQYMREVLIIEDGEARIHAF